MQNSQEKTLKATQSLEHHSLALLTNDVSGVGKQVLFHRGWVKRGFASHSSFSHQIFLTPSPWSHTLHKHISEGHTEPAISNGSAHHPEENDSRVPDSVRAETSPPLSGTEEVCALYGAEGNQADDAQQQS